MQIDFRQEIKEMFDERGHWIVLRQAYAGRLCPCVQPTTKEALKDCNLCLSSGRAFVDRFTKCRKSRKVRLTQTIGFEFATAVGTTAPPDAIFYLEHYIRPTTVDYILEIALSTEDAEPLTPFKIISVYDISDVREQRDQRGRLEYYAVSGERKSWPEFTMTEI